MTIAGFRAPLIPKGSTGGASGGIEADEQATVPQVGGISAASATIQRRPPPLLAVVAALLLALCWACSDLHCGASILQSGLTRRRKRYSQPPYCRKSSSIAVPPPSNNGSIRDSLGDSSSDGNLSLLVWSGMGRHKHIFDDLHAFDLQSGSWSRLLPAGSTRPVPRWKAGGAQVAAGGLVVVGGDAYTPDTLSHHYRNDIWRLDPASLSWSMAVVNPAAPAPAPRRGHSTAHYTGQDGLERLVVVGGRTRNESGVKVVLNDVWVATLMWPHATWQQLAPLQPEGDMAPAPRRGHTAVMLPGSNESGSPQLLMYGGRDDWRYFGDLWLFSISEQRWQRLPPANGTWQHPQEPAGRDHHSAAVAGSKLFVWGGRSGHTYADSKPMGDLWVFNLETQAWQQLPQDKARPLPRFEHSSFQYTPPDSPGPRLLIFGGQSEGACQLNDVWELELGELMWRQLSAPKLCSHRCRRRRLWG